MNTFLFVTSRVLMIFGSKHVEHVEPRLDPETGVYKMGGMKKVSKEIRI
jgi:hypothetical protein